MEAMKILIRMMEKQRPEHVERDLRSGKYMCTGTTKNIDGSKHFHPLAKENK